MSESTALKVMRMAASTGSSVPTNPAIRGGGEDKRLPKMRPNTTNTTTGIPTVPMRPSGSRTKILISSQVSFRSWRNISAPNRMPRHLQEHVLERRQHGPEVRDVDAVFRQAVDHVRHEIVS